jgi:hypothetical protein
MRGKEIVLEELPAYAAVALAGIGWLPDTLLSRSIIIRMRRRHAGERVEGFRRRIHEIDGWKLRDQIAVWARAAISEVKWPELPAQIADRDADVWEPLIAVADAIGGTWPDRAREAAVALVAQSKEVEPSLGIKLLTDLQCVFGEADELPSKNIVQSLIAMQESPWGDLRGKPLDERGLAHRLRQYGVKSRTIRQGSSTPRGYLRADLIDLWARYIPGRSATSATAETSIHAEGITASAVSLVADVLPRAAMGRVCAHCDQPGGEFCNASLNGSTIWLHLECKDEFAPTPEVGSIAQVMRALCPRRRAASFAKYSLEPRTIYKSFEIARSAVFFAIERAVVQSSVCVASLISTRSYHERPQEQCCAAAESRRRRLQESSGPQPLQARAEW